MLDFILLDFSWTQLLQPQWYIDNGGLWLLLVIIFAETGLFIGSFSPEILYYLLQAYSVISWRHLYTIQGSDFLNLLMISALCIGAGILGNTVGYIFGRRVGPAMYNWKDRLLFKQNIYIRQRIFTTNTAAGPLYLQGFFHLSAHLPQLLPVLLAWIKRNFHSLILLAVLRGSFPCYSSGITSTRL